MAINVQHIHSTHCEITYTGKNDEQLYENMTATMDDIQEEAITILVKHDFISAHVCDANTGELLMIIERT